ncbi:golvesin C-terminal-like domain-containing protein [Paenibacillus alkalitolerans]|uniref:golvesin C-terminal-like domain-containing protein n=1 Tax=Paenibacillus alkalitolerans TaxID=2799335 RepID=UPI0018F70779|nr:family 16 glycoside hydrolase [Paenibacillus alkalitolerans]
MRHQMRYASMFCAFILLVSALFSFSPGRAQAGFTNFITRDADKFMDGTTEFRFIGSNVPFLGRAWMDPTEIEDLIRGASISGIDVIRLYPFEVKMNTDPEGIYRHVMGPGNYNESAFKLFDKVLQLANQYNVRLIIPFVDKYNYVGGVADWAAFRNKSADEFWSDPRIKQDFKDFINYVVNRTNTYTNVQYKDDKAIMAWQLGNELHSTDSWVSEMAAYFKSLDSNHLVGDGGYVRAQGIRQNALDDPNIDFIDPHIYRYHNYSDPIAKINEWRNTTKGKKPLIIGEFGDFSPEITEQLLSTVQSNGTSGAMFWATMPHHKMGGWHWQPVGNWVYLRYPGFATGDWANESVIIGKLRSYSYSIKGLTVPAWPAPDAPVMFPADSVNTLSWLGASGAGAFEIERSTDPSGPWDVIGTEVTDDITTPRHYNLIVPIFSDTTAVKGNSYYYRVRAKNADGLYSPYSNVIGPVASNGAVIIDNVGSGYTESGTWGDSSLPDSYGGSSRYSSNSGSTAKWTPNLPTAGYYNVYVTYPSHLKSNEYAQYTIYHNGTTNTVTVDQTTMGRGRWRLIDTAYFEAGTGGYVRLTASSGSNTRADAVMFEPVSFGDHFQSGGTLNWKVLSGNWSVEDDGTKVLKQSGNGTAETVTGAIYSDAAVTAAVKAYNNTKSNASSGLVARANADLSSMYTMHINYDANKVQLYKKVKGSWANLGEAHIEASPGTWYLLRLELKGSSIKGYVNGVQKISADDSSLTDGYIGLRTSGQTVVFDNVIVTTK